MKDKYGNLDFLSKVMIRSGRPDMFIDISFYEDIFPIVFVAVIETLISAKIAE